MYECIYGCEHIDAASWTDMCADVDASEWRPLVGCLDVNRAIDSRGPIEIISVDYASLDYEVEETWHWRDTCQCQGRDYHIYVHRDRYYGEPLETAIIRRVGPDLHVDMDITEQEGRKPRMEFTYRLSGNLICELEADTVARLLPSASDVEFFLKCQVGGLTDQQRVLLHASPIFEEFLARGKTKTDTRPTQGPAKSN
jgi:hypothetical protein